jgi:hypothetical protein
MDALESRLAAADKPRAVKAHGIGRRVAAHYADAVSLERISPSARPRDVHRLEPVDLARMLGQAKPLSAR